MGTRIKAWCLPLALGTALLVASAAFAASDGDAVEAKAKIARTACLAGDADKGATLLAELFVETRDFNHIYNQGRCFEQNHRYQDALSRFREYLRKAPALSEADRLDAEEHVRECEKLATGPTPSAALPLPAPPEAQPVAPPLVSQPAPVDVTQAGAVTEQGNRGRILRIAGIASGALGLASFGTGLYFYTRAVSLSDDVSSSDNPSASDHKAGKNAETMQWVFHGIGAAAVATGAVLYYLGWRSSTGDTPAVAPLAGPGLAGLSAQGTF
jgi:hypothetical protein